VDVVKHVLGLNGSYATVAASVRDIVEVARARLFDGYDNVAAHIAALRTIQFLNQNAFCDGSWPWATFGSDHELPYIGESQTCAALAVAALPSAKHAVNALRVCIGDVDVVRKCIGILTHEPYTGATTALVAALKRHVANVEVVQGICSILLKQTTVKREIGLVIFGVAKWQLFVEVLRLHGDDANIVALALDLDGNVAASIASGRDGVVDASTCISLCAAEAKAIRQHIANEAVASAGARLLSIASDDLAKVPETKFHEYGGVQIATQLLTLHLRRGEVATRAARALMNAAASTVSGSAYENVWSEQDFSPMKALVNAVRICGDPTFNSITAAYSCRAIAGLIPVYSAKLVELGAVEAIATLLTHHAKSDVVASGCLAIARF
jgi:hypothetical protein